MTRCAHTFRHGLSVVEEGVVVFYVFLRELDGRWFSREHGQRAKNGLAIDRR
jgi:hypothetical protein